MEHQKIINLLDETTNQPSEFRTRNWVEINDESQGTYSVSNQINFKTLMIRSNLCDYSDTHINGKRNITVQNTLKAVAPNSRNKKVIFKNCAPFTNCISEINQTQVDDAHHFDVVIPMYNLIECSDPYSKTLRGLWQYYRDEPALNNNNVFFVFPSDTNDSI